MVRVKNPKEKGNNFERKVAKLLSDWAGSKFMRTPSSGAIHNFNDKRVVSDIVAPLSIGNFPFSIECKNVECSWEWSTLLEGTSMTLNAHWEQCKNDAQREGLVPLLIVTKNFRDIYTIMSLEDWRKLPDVVINQIPTLILTWNETCIESVVFFKLKLLLDTMSLDELLSVELGTS